MASNGCVLLVLLVCALPHGSRSLMPSHILDTISPNQESKEEMTCEDVPGQVTATTFPCDVWTDGHTRYCKPAFLFIGCQKCGSSSFWKAMMDHPDVKYTGPKELLFWKGNSAPGHEQAAERVSVTRACDYYGKLNDIAIPDNGANVDIHEITGEFSATYFECVGCPNLFKQILPQAKMMVMLREPWGRALSRYKEQVAFGENKVVKDSSWANFRDSRFVTLTECLADAGGVVSLSAKCASNDNVFGWSMHAVFLRNWIDAGYSATDFLILYLDDFASDPVAQMRKVERFLNLPKHNYRAEVVEKKYNAAGHYGWGVASLQNQDGGDMTIKQFYADSVKDLRGLCHDNDWQQPPTTWDLQ